MELQDAFKALSDATRREILSLLKNGSKTAGEIGSHFPMTGATLSHHLSVLTQAGLLSSQRQGKYIHYALDRSAVAKLSDYLMTLTEPSRETPPLSPLLSGESLPHPKEIPTPQMQPPIVSSPPAPGAPPVAEPIRHPASPHAPVLPFRGGTRGTSFRK